MRAYCFFINLRNISYPIWNNGTRVLTWRTFNDPKTYAGAGHTECCVAAVNQGPSATRVRFLKPTKIMKPAGWHFSYLGGVEAIQRKMKSIAHTEFDTEKRTSLPSIENMLANGRGFVNSAERFLPEIIDDSLHSVQQKQICESDNIGSKWKKTIKTFARSNQKQGNRQRLHNVRNRQTHTPFPRAATA